MVCFTGQTDGFRGPDDPRQGAGGRLGERGKPMRFILKAAFFLGLIAFFMPFGGAPKEANISMVGAFVGAQQAIADLTGFCDRAPQACDTGRELAVFAGERITDGAAFAYSLVQEKVEGRDAPTVAVSLPTDPVNTGAVPGAALPAIPAEAAAPKGPLPYMPPKRMTAEADVDPAAATAETPAPAATTGARPHHAVIPAIPTPAPRV